VTRPYRFERERGQMQLPARAAERYRAASGQVSTNIAARDDLGRGDIPARLPLRRADARGIAEVVPLEAAHWEHR